MKTKKIDIAKVRVNENNPRTITAQKLNKLELSILSFPKMLDLRPIVVDNRGVVLGGNMRTKALQEISMLDLAAIANRLTESKDFMRMTKTEQQDILAHWQDWLEDKKVTVVEAESLSEADKKRFIIEDNASFGQWDYDKLANEWEVEDLNAWGVDVWLPETQSSAPSAGGVPIKSVDLPETGVAGSENLPEELQHLDLSPDELPKLQGTDETLRERIIIVYPKQRVEEIAKLLGLDSIDKVVYNIDEIIPAE